MYEYLKYSVFMGGIIKKDQLLQMNLVEREKLLNSIRSYSEDYWTPCTKFSSCL